MRPALAAPDDAHARLDGLPLVVVALVGLLALRLAALWVNGTDLFFDEAQYWSWAQEPAFGYYSKPPLIAALIGATTAVCGETTFCVRLAAPVLHSITALLIFLVASRLYDTRTGTWSAILFATLPGISFSSGLISTDVPLLTAWALALLGLVGLLLDGKAWAPAFALGVGLGLGLNAKYAMGFFVLSLAVYLIAVPAARPLLRDARLWVALGIGALLIAPNLVWNLSNGFATFAHTADNAKWGGRLLNPGKGFEFLAGQIAVFGPILIGGLVLVLRRGWFEGLSQADKLLVCFTLPVLLIISTQAFVSRAHANWAATAYVAAVILVAATFIRLDLDLWLRRSLALHLVLMVAIIGATTAAGRFVLPAIGDPFQRTLGWRELGQRTAEVIEAARRQGTPFRAVMADDRAATASLLYYMRDRSLPILAWRPGARPLDHYELTRPFRGAKQTPVLLVSLREDRERITRHFKRIEESPVVRVPAGLGAPREVRFITLDGYTER